MPDPPRAPASGTLLRVLTHTQNASAAVFGIFMGVHLAAPIAAAISGTSGADNVMLVGREYYLFLEPVAVYLPLGLHIAASTARRAILYYRTRRLNLSTHAVLGYTLLPLVIPHLMLHRLIPADPSPPISGLSPSEFGYEFVGYACATRPWMTAGYVALTGVALWHALVGSMKVVAWARRLLRPARDEIEATIATGEKALKEGPAVNTAKTPKSPRRRLSLRAVVTAITAVVCLGVVRMTADAKGMSSFIATRYDAVFAAAPWSAILR